MALLHAILPSFIRLNRDYKEIVNYTCSMVYIGYGHAATQIFRIATTQHSQEFIRKPILPFERYSIVLNGKMFITFFQNMDRNHEKLRNFSNLSIAFYSLNCDNLTSSFLEYLRYSWRLRPLLARSFARAILCDCPSLHTSVVSCRSPGNQKRSSYSDRNKDNGLLP